jgi:hypothetical protein
VLPLNKTFKLIAVLGFSAALTTACQFDTTPEERQARSGYTDRDGNSMNTGHHGRYELYDVRNGRSEDHEKFGFVREQASPVKNSQRYNENIAAVDYEELANIISKMVVQLPEIDDVATLVTDEEVLIAYKTSGKNREQIADQVSKTGLSFVPRFYHVYVSDNPQMIADIERFRTLTVSSPNIDKILENTIDTMLESPQGKDLTKGENANGEGKGEMNEELEQEYSEHVRKMRKTQ